MSMFNRVSAVHIIYALLFFCGTSAHAAPSEPVTAEHPGYLVKGFRSAAFGMSSDSLLSAIKSDFGVTSDKVQVYSNPTDRTTSYTINVDSLSPGPGAAKITYIIGAKTRKLIKIGVVWISPKDPTNEQRTELVNDGLVLVNYFRAQNWPPKSTREGVPMGSNALALFVGKDTAGGAAEVELKGVAFDRKINGKTEASPTPKGPAALLVIYSADIVHPDVFHLDPGSF